jgi:signal transduction histidine kinase
LFRFLIIALLTAGIRPLYGASIDSLLQALPKQTDTLEKIKLLDQIAQSAKYDDPELSLQYARQELDLARKVNNREYEVIAMSRIGENFFNIEDFSRALEYGRKAEQLCLKYDDKKHLGNAYNSIGNVYFMRQDWAKAREFYERSLNLRRQHSDPRSIAGNLNNIAKILIEEKQYVEAETYLKEALLINRKGGQWQWETFNLMNFGELEIERGNYRQAIEYLDEGLVLADSNQFYSATSALLNLKARAEAAMGRYIEAREILMTILSDPRQPNEEDKVEASEQLSELFEKAGNYREALRYRNQAAGMKDSLSYRAEIRKIENIEIANRIQTEDRIAQMEIEQQVRESDGKLRETQLEKYIYLMGLLVVMAIAGGLFAAYRVHRRNNRTLARLVDERSQDLERSHTVLNTFVYRSSHEIRGTITSIQGLYQLLEGGLSSNDEVLPHLGMKIRQLEKGQRNLILSMELSRSEPNMANINVREIANDVVSNIQAQYGNDQVDFQLDLPNHAHWTVDAVLMRAILDNLLDNSVVFREPGRQPWCKISMKTDRESMEFRVEDNGMGIPPDVSDQAFDMFYRGSNHSKGSGLGLYIVKLAVEKMGGTIRLEKKPDPGTLFVINLPKAVLDTKK